ncbi:NhaP-type Na+/H+ or K+/H+ antiporter [Spinactinospora alkalitolerans]|uniref:NhaP-type Na+/H+ or K+/H+ antiporter n=1 Tax=Spinactinospora alkalitolerans TaxID=687207 RepID=A0A852U190_9ACTN|nr:cation:proton antiporter [Spinactinospora alkalitolerans]NYE49305.1 NhaP-type Na+/H+ or K+/H+ antiporter [Spinactinospora alkalitolerans]
MPRDPPSPAPKRHGRGEASRISTFNLALLAVGATVLLVGLFSDLVKRAMLSGPLIALVLGVLLGPQVTGLLDPARWGEESLLLEQAARLTVAMSLMGIAMRLSGPYFRRNTRSLAVVLVPLMVAMWLVTGLLAFWILGVPIWVAMLVGAVLTPTDPVVASSIVQGSVAQRCIPARVRNFLSAESGANDGLAYPLVFLAVLMLERPAAEALPHWLLHTLLWEVGAAVILGAALGYVAGLLLRWGRAHHTDTGTSLLVYSLALTLTVLGATKLAGTDGLLAVFVAGLLFSRTISAEDEKREENIQEAINNFFLLPVFVLLGLALPWREWAELGWRGPALAVAVLLLRRLPAYMALSPLMHPVRDLRETVFLGWFGPIGVAALFYANLSLHETPTNLAWTAGSLVICASVLAHGVTAKPMTQWLGRGSRP